MIWARIQPFLVILCFWIVIAFTLGGPEHAKGEVITGDHGGMIGTYIERFTQVKLSGEVVIINGDCLSACTLVLGFVPHSKICVTPQARLGFHAAWMPDEDGLPVTHVRGTQELWRRYPPAIQHWLRNHGMLTRKMVFLSGRELSRMYSRCSPLATMASANVMRVRPIIFIHARAQ
jgi:hypothetical protein